MENLFSLVYRDHLTVDITKFIDIISVFVLTVSLRVGMNETNVDLFAYRYCVEFEVLKASKACRKEPSYSSLREGKCTVSL